MIHAIDMLGGCWPETMRRASWQAAVAIAVAWAICRILKRIPPALKCWVWRGVYVKLLIALVPLTAVELPVLSPASSKQGVVPSSSDMPVIADRPLAATVTRDAPPAAVEQVRPVDWSTWLMLGWAAGALAYAAQLVVRWRSVAADRRRSRPAREPLLLEAYARVARRFNAARVPPLRVCDRGGGPRLVGLLRPVVIVPEALLGSDDRRQIELLLAHELVHHLRRDLWWSWLCALGRVLFWFHPAVWFAERQWRLAEESACDHAAIAAMSAPPADYARMLVDVACRFRATGRSPAAVGVIDSKKTLQQRLLAMRNISIWPRRWRLSFGLLVACITVAAIVPWRLVAQQTHEAEPSNEARHPAADASPASHPADRPPFHKPDPHNESGRREIWATDNLATGLVTAAQVNLAARSAGIIRDIRCAEGQRVKKGDVLVELDDRRARAEYEIAKAKFKQASVHFERLTELFKTHSVSPGEVDDAAAERDVTAAQLEIANQALEETRVISPISGVVGECRAVVGQVAERRAFLAQVIDVDHLRVEFDAPPHQYSHLRMGQKIRISLAGQRSKPLAAKISFVSPKVDPHSNFGRVRANVEDPDHVLKPGMQVDIDLQLYREEDLPH